MAKYNLNIHHRDVKIVKDKKTDNYQIERSPVGHFYVSLQEENKEPIFFGKYPKEDSWLNSLFGPGKIVSDDEQIVHDQLMKADKDLDTKHVYTRTITLNESEYYKALDFAKANANGNIGDNFYFIGASDCHDFVQDVWLTAGRSLPFTVIFSIDEMKKLNTLAADNLLSRFGSRDIIASKSLIVEDISKENVARKFKLALDNIQEIDALNNAPAHIACYEGIQLTKYFKIVVNPEVINNALVGVSEVNINNTMESVTTAASETINIQNDTTPQVSPEMQELITSFKLPNITSTYHVGYKDIDTHQIPIDHSYISDPSAMNQTVRWMLNIHHSTNNGNSEALNNVKTNEKEGEFYISLVSPQKTIFYGNNIKEHNNKTTKDIHTKSIALSWCQHGEAEEWANRHSNMTKADSNIASIYDKDGRQFIQDLWHFLEKPLYFTVAYSTDELLKLGTKSAKELLNVFGSFDTIKHGQFIDKDLSKELLADRLNIDVDSIVDGGIGYNNTAVVKSFVVNVEQKLQTLIDQTRAMVISSFNTPEQCRIVTKHNNITVQSSEALEALGRNKNTKVIDLVGSVLQQYQWDFNDNKLDSIMCLNDQQELKYEYTQHQPSLFYARCDLVKNIFNHSPLANNKSFDSYLLSGFGEPFNIHMWYVQKMLGCKYIGNSILGYNISDKGYDSVTLVNNIIQHWNSKLDLLSTKSELNISVIPSYDYRTYNLVYDTIYKTLSPLGFKQSYSSSGPDKSSQVYYALECESINSTDDVTNNKHRYHQGEGNYRKHHIDTHHTKDDYRGYQDIEVELKFKDTTEHEVLVSSDDTDHMMFSSAKPIGYNALNFLKSQVGKIQELTLSNFIESVHRWYKSDDHKISEEIIVMKDSNIVLDNVSNLDDLMLDTNILSSQAALALNNVALLSNEYRQDLVSTTNNAFNINGTLMLANLVIRMITPVTQEMTANDTTSNTHEITVDNNVVEPEHAHRLAYSSYAHDIEENGEYTELVGVV